MSIRVHLWFYWIGISYSLMFRLPWHAILSGWTQLSAIRRLAVDGNKDLLTFLVATAFFLEVSATSNSAQGHQTLTRVLLTANHLAVHDIDKPSWLAS